MTKLQIIKAFAILSFFAFIPQASLFSQTFEGRITFEYDFEQLPERLQDKSAVLFQRSTTYIKGHKSRMETIRAGSTVVTITDLVTKEGLILINTGNLQWAIEMDLEEKPEKVKKKKKPKKAEREIKYLEEYVEILGYECQKVEIRSNSSGKKEMLQIAYVTQEIDAIDYKFKFLNGFPLTIETHRDDIIGIISASSIIEDTVDPALFNMDIPKGFEEMSMKELEKMLGRRLF